MKQKHPLFILSFLCLFLTSFFETKPAKANVFDEAFGIISGYSRSFGFSRSLRYSKRRYRKKKRYSARRRVRRAVRRRRLYKRRMVRARARRRYAHKKRFYALRRRKIAARKRRARLARIVAHRNRRQAQLRSRKLRKYFKNRKKNQGVRRVVKPVHSQKRYSKVVKPPLKFKRKIAKRKYGKLVQKGVVARSVPRREYKITKPRIVEQARSGLSYGHGDDFYFLSGLQKKKVQRALTLAGFFPGADDGIFGVQTKRAIRAYQKSLDQRHTGHLNRVQIASLLSAVIVSKGESSGYLPKREQAVKKREIIRKRAKALNNRLKARALAQVKSQDKVKVSPKVKVKRPEKARPVAEKIIAVKSEKRLQAANKLRAKKVKKPLITNNGAAEKAARSVLFSAVAKPVAKINKRLKHIKQARLQNKNLSKAKTSRKVDYFHILTKTQRGENLWVVKCVHKQKLKLYYWRDQKWWVRGNDGGAIGHSAYGENGIQRLAKKVCTL